MDVSAITNDVMNALNALVPYIGAAGTAIATNAANSVYAKGVEQAKHLYEKIKERFAREKDGASATTALQIFVDGDTDYTFVVKTKLERILRDDPAFAQDLLRIIQSGPIQSLIVGEEAEARRIAMTNIYGQGSQACKRVEVPLQKISNLTWVLTIVPRTKIVEGYLSFHDLCTYRIPL